ncbi:MAG: hypothetical protein WBN56_05255 [Robiginitalea sp.]|uniref:hypothetical protein n=1 Tax=Robiginitalea sp. TaxID=1902411 RepID=UPI003C73BDD6
MSTTGISHLPVYRRALELQTMSNAIAFCIASRRDFLNLYTSDSLRDQVTDALLTDTLLIRKQIALAASTRSLHIRRGSLQFISIMIRNLNSYCRGLEMDGVREREYLDLMQTELRSFRKSFKTWRKSLG